MSYRIQVKRVIARRNVIDTEDKRPYYVGALLTLSGISSIPVRSRNYTIPYLYCIALIYYIYLYFSLGNCVNPLGA